MTVPKYLILLLVVLFYSCGNNLTRPVEANSLDTSKSVDTIKQIAKPKPADTALLKVWSTFQQAVSTNNFSKFRQLSLDSLYACDTTLSTTNFIKNCYKEVFDTLLLRKFTISTEINQVNKTMQPGYFTESVLNKADFTGESITLKQFQVVKEFTPDGAWTVTFDFIKTKEGYRFFGCNSYGGPICCR
jgi:hypothetical protein